MAEFVEFGNESTDPFRSISLLSQVFMYWTRSIISKTKDVTSAIVTEMPAPIDIQLLADKLTVEWEREIQKPVPSYFRCTAKVFAGKYVRYFLPFVIMTVGQVCISLTINFLTESLGREDADLLMGIGLAALYSFISFVTICCVNQGFFRGAVLGSMIRHSISLVLFKKLVNLPKHTTSSRKFKGTFLTLLASELDVLDMLGGTPYLVLTPFFILMAVPVIVWLLGPAGIVGIGAVLLIYPLKGFLLKHISRFRSNTIDLKEARVKTIQDLIEGIKSVKMYAWEEDLVKEIEDLKHLEHRQYTKTNIISTISSTFLICGSSVVLLLTLLTYVYLGNQIQAGSIFSALSLLLVMNNLVCGITNFGIDVTVYLKSMFKKITEVMIQTERLEQRQLNNSVGEESVKCQNMSATWQPEVRMAPCLKSIGFQLNKGELCIIIGAVGAGKSALLSALAGELSITEGSVSISGTVAMVEQDPWITLGTVQDNITIGQRMDEAWYLKVLNGCGLQTDLQQMQDGDLTFVGEGGSTLSGGQKARIGLARATYHRRNVYLMDDPLSAVDASVGLQIFTECILGLMKPTTRILVTNNYQFLPYADKVIVMSEGTVARFCTYAELKDSKELSSITQEKHATSHVSKPDFESSFSSVAAENEIEKGKEVTEEPNGVPINTYFKYLQLFFHSYWALGFLLVLAVLLQVGYLAPSYWVSYWASQSHSEQENLLYVWVFLCIIGYLFFICIIRNFLIYFGLCKSNERLHNKAIRGVSFTDLSFFDTNPSGRIISRFTKDMAVMEEQFVSCFSDVLLVASVLISYLVAILVMNPYNGCTVVVILFGLYRVSKRFLPSCRRIKRLELTAKAKIVEVATSTVSGIQTIRSLGLVDAQYRKYYQTACNSYKTQFFSIINLRVYQVAVDYLSILFLSGNALAAVLIKGYISAEILAVGFSFTVIIISYLGWFTDIYVSVGNHMISGQRLFQYADLVPEPKRTSNYKLTVLTGSINFDNVNLQYRPGLPNALKDVNFTIRGGTKVGIVGRTGAGKSSLLLALLRLKELASGSIRIDGQDIARVGLIDLRSQVTVIPQSPLLFHGHLRKNADPTHKFPSAQVDSVLEDLQLLPFAEQDGLHLSAGQKQLLCLARALLRDTVIYVYDEATGNIDPAMEALLQEKMKEKLQKKTVLTIAHRLTTVLTCQQIMVMEAGTCVEMGTPQELRQEPFSRFNALLRGAASAPN